MTDTTESPSSNTVVPQGLLARVVGVLVSPRATYAAIAAQPRSLGALAVGVGLIVVTTFAFMSTTVGQEATLDSQYRAIESFGMQLPPEAYERMEAGMGAAPYLAAVTQLITIPIVVAAIAGLLIVIFNFVMGGEATYRQVFAVASHAGVIFAVGSLFATPLNYATGVVETSRANLALFTPFLSDTSFVARLLGVIDLFWVWWMVNLAIGVGVLYKRKTGPIATAFLVLYGVVALAIAAWQTFAGA